MRDRLVPSFWTLQLGGWLAFYVALVASVLGRWPLEYALAEKAVTVVLGLVLTTALWPLHRRLFRHNAPLRVLVVFSLVVSYLGSFVWNTGYRVVFNAVVGPWFGDQADPAKSLGQVFVDSIYNSPLLLAWSVPYFGIKHYQALAQERERTLAAQAEAHHARLRALRYQLNPHFLFNTLNAVSTLVVEQRNREAAAMIARLSDFLRATLNDAGAPDVPLAEEIDFARRYLDIEQIRFGERLHVTFDVDDEVLAVPVPALILQPLVENAIKHAVAPREDGGRIVVQARREGETLVLWVMDDGPGLDPAAAVEGGGIGLANTRDRLRQLYGEAGRLHLERADGGGLCAAVHIPLGAATARVAA
jgi:signal transduction histidine kinase